MICVSFSRSMISRDNRNKERHAIIISDWSVSKKTWGFLRQRGHPDHKSSYFSKPLAPLPGRWDGEYSFCRLQSGHFLVRSVMGLMAGFFVRLWRFWCWPVRCGQWHGCGIRVWLCVRSLMALSDWDAISWALEEIRDPPRAAFWMWMIRIGKKERSWRIKGWDWFWRYFTSQILCDDEKTGLRPPKWRAPEYGGWEVGKPDAKRGQRKRDAWPSWMMHVHLSSSALFIHPRLNSRIRGPIKPATHTGRKGYTNVHAVTDLMLAWYSFWRAM